MHSSARIAHHPIHTMLVHFPIAFWAASFVADIAAAANGGSHAFAFYLVAAGCIGAALAVVFGAIDLIGIQPRASRHARAIARSHSLVSVASMGAWLANALVRPAPELMVTGAWILSSLGLVLLGVGAYLGGRLVYEFRIGVAEGVAPDGSGSHAGPRAGAR